MNSIVRTGSVIAVCGLLVSVRVGSAQDWPQWRGPNRDAKAVGFKAPATWPATLTKKWDITVGDGVANPSLVGDRLYVFAREGGDEVIRCLKADSGDEVWKMSNPADQVSGADNGFPGPRATPTVSGGKVITLGVQGLLTCWNAADGKQLWQKDEFVGNVPGFHTSSSPIVVDGVCIAQLGSSGEGGRRGGPPPSGAMVAYDLVTGQEKWRAKEAAASYGSPALMTVEGMKVVFAPTETNMVGVNVADGKVVWQIPYKQGRYNSASPIVDGQTLIIAGPGTGLTVLKMSKDGDMLKETEVSTTKFTANSVGFNTPVLKDGALFGLASNDQLFCVGDIAGAEPKAAWATPIAKAAAALLMPASGQTIFAQQQPDQPGRGGGMGAGQRRGGQRRGGGMMSGGGYGSVVDAGSVLLAISPAADLVVFKPSKDSYEEVARYKVSEDGSTYAYPILSGKGIYIKDKDSVSLWTVD